MVETTPTKIFVVGELVWKRPTPVVDVLEFTDDHGRVYQLRGGAISRLGAALDGLLAAHRMAGRFEGDVSK